MLTKRTFFEIVLLIIICLLSYQLFLVAPPKQSLNKNLNPPTSSILKQVNADSVKEKASPEVNDYKETTDMERWLIDAIIDLSSEELIEETLTKMMYYERDDLLQITDIKLFTKSMLKALTGPVNFSDKNEMIPDIGFSNDPANQSSDTNGNNIFKDPNEVRANFSSKNYGQSHVIARWYNTDTGTVMSFGRQPVTPYADNTYIWLKKDNWPEGNYQVDIFQENSHLTPLTSGSFQIDSKINNHAPNNVTAKKETIIKVPNMNKNILKNRRLQ
tara:strand:- start:53 stop:871 length:819 start_codon:yes stop_codon:yes gene_type:complete